MQTGNVVWLFVVFVEGFASLGIEVVALRRLVPHLGSSITVTAPTIALFLLALAAGYWSGGQVRADQGRRVRLNFLAAALISGVGLSSVFVDGLFEAVREPMPAWLLFMALAVCPPAWLLAQTVPLATHLLAFGRAGATSGTALAASTAGSVLGASVLALVVMQRLGVSAAVLLCSASLAAAVLAAPGGGRQRLGRAGAAGLLLVAVSALNLMPRLHPHETAYADYRVLELRPLAAQPDGSAAGSRVFIVNHQRASKLGPGTPPARAAYVERMQQILRDELGFAERRILVLGAGGFTLSAGDAANDYTYVDIDPAIRAIAERDFLRAPIRGRFVAGDARRFAATTESRFDAIVVDAYSAHASVPAHLVTLEFWRSLRRPLERGGAVLINAIADSALQSAYARNLLATIEAGLGRCTVEVLDRAAAVSNVVLTCRPPAAGLTPAQLYTDERNPVDRDRGILGF